jgi:hypothetical protein
MVCDILAAGGGLSLQGWLPLAPWVMGPLSGWVIDLPSLDSLFSMKLRATKNQINTLCRSSRTDDALTRSGNPAPRNPKPGRPNSGGYGMRQTRKGVRRRREYPRPRLRNVGAQVVHLRCPFRKPRKRGRPTPPRPQPLTPTVGRSSEWSYFGHGHAFVTAASVSKFAGI